ncbi:MAG TPA: cupin domain-containing protein, partial [Actinophytocola sp.]|uniref:JmjC domain-containing protein n=1 Tax=Actinophytocola sp. TaxID=1872138 RepID=UPI002E0A890C|nr:cupin domain-containing protein [Actinophytocola sp.]
NLRALAGALGTRFASQCDVIAFLTPAGRRGLAPHHDPVDVFVIQLEGTKSWRVWPAPEHRRGDDAGNLNESALGEPAVETTLEPGDVQTGVEVSHHLRDAAAADAIGPDRPLARAESISVLERGDNGKVKASVNGAVTPCRPTSSKRSTG